MVRALLLFLASSAGAQVLVNGSFEGPSAAHTLNLAGAFVLPGWSGLGPVMGGNAGLVVGVDSGLAPAEGRQHFTFNGGNPGDRGWIEQAFSTVPGAAYVLTFAVGRSGGGQELALGVEVGGWAGVFTPPSSRGYATASLGFVAAGSVSTLRFSDLSGGNSISDMYLDNVAVSAVPEPGAWAAIIGAVALAAAVWRRR